MEPAPPEDPPASPAPTAEAIRAVILDLARQQLGLAEPLADDADLAEHLDSVQRLTLVVAIEDRFEVCFDEEDDEQVRTLADAVQAVRRRLEAADG